MAMRSNDNENNCDVALLSSKWRGGYGAGGTREGWDDGAYRHIYKELSNLNVSFKESCTMQRYMLTHPISHVGLHQRQLNVIF